MTCGCGFFAGKKLPPTVLLTKRATIAAWIWFPFYFLWPIISNWLVYDLLNFNSNDSFGAALQNFLDHLGSIFLILLLILYVMNFIRLDQHFKNIFLWLQTKGRPLSLAIAIGLAAITPSGLCYIISIFICLTQARIPLGVAIAYLISSSFINDATIAEFYGSLDWQITQALMVFGPIIGFVAGLIFDRLETKNSPRFSTVETKFDNDTMQQARCSDSSYRNAWNDTWLVFRKIGLLILVVVAATSYIEMYLLISAS